MTTKTPTRKTVQADTGVRAVDMHRILSDAALFASKDSALPMLHGVQLESTGTSLIARGTDRFTLGVSSTPYEGPKFTIFVRLDDVDLLRTALKPRRGKWADRVVSIHVTPTAKTLRVAIEGTQLSVRTQDLEFPKTNQLFPRDGGLQEVSSFVGFNPEYMARFGRVGGRYAQARYFLQGPSKPAIITVGDRFVGLIMPIRTPEGTPGQWEWPEWLPK